MTEDGLMMGKVTKIISGSTYGGRIYTQEVVIELLDGSELRVSDANRKCSEEMIGEPRQFGLQGISIQEIRKNEEDEFTLIPVDVNLSSGISILKGRLEAFCYEGGDNSALLVSFGSGEIELELGVEQGHLLNGVSVGDFITAENISEVYLYRIVE